MRLPITILLLVIFESASANETGVFAGLNLGHTGLDIDQNFEDDSDSEAGFGAGVSLGYLFGTNIVTQVGATGSENFSLFGASDRYKLQHVDLSLGYKARWKDFVLTPKIGYADWEVQAKEGQLFNPGSEESKKQSGKDFLWGASFGYAFGSKFELSLSHKAIHTDFGGYNFSHVELTVNI